MTKAWGKVIDAKNEKNKASKIIRSFANTYKTEIPTIDRIQYPNAVLTYFLKCARLYFPYKNMI